MTDNEQTPSERVLVDERVVLVRRGKRGIWQAEFHWHGHRRVTTRTANLRIARQRGMEIELELIKGTYSPHVRSEAKPNRVKLEDAKQAFRKFHESETTRRRTYVRYDGILSIFLEFAAVAKVHYLDQIDLKLVDRFRAKRRPEIGDGTMYHEGATLKRFLTWCVERKLVASNPLENQKYIQPRTKKKNVLSLEQVNAILREATPARHDIFAMLAFTGMRVSECLNLRVEDVDLDGGWIHIRSRPGFETKTGEEWKVPIHPRLHNILSRRKSRRRGWYFTAQPSSRYPKGDHQLPTKRINEDLKPVLDKLKIPHGLESDGFTTHSLRHFFKTFCIVSGVPKPIVDEWQGHELKSKPSEHYFHLMDEDSQRHMRQVPFGDGTNA